MKQLFITRKQLERTQAWWHMQKCGGSTSRDVTLLKYYYCVQCGDWERVGEPCMCALYEGYELPEDEDPFANNTSYILDDNDLPF